MTPQADTFFVPAYVEAHINRPSWYAGRYNDDDGQWTCKHRHVTRDEAQKCAEAFGARMETAR